MVNSMLPEDKKVNLEEGFRNYAMPYDWRINDSAWLKELDNKSANSGNSSSDKSPEVQINLDSISKPADDAKSDSNLSVSKKDK
jgi:hypothetical protein